MRADWIAFAAAVSMAGSANAATYKAKCSYFSGNVAVVDAKCVQSDSTSSKNILTESYALPGRTVVVRYGKSQDQWTLVQIDGQPGIAYEINRDHHTFTTLDLKTSFEVEMP